MIPAKQAGRSKEKHIPSAGEPRKKKTCGNYGRYGHSRLSCQFESIVNSSNVNNTADVVDGQVPNS